MRRIHKVGVIWVVATFVAVTIVATIYLCVRPVEKVSKATTEQEITTPTITFFDPNTVSYEQMIAMGLSRTVAVSVLKYRARGKVFEIAEEFALCYGVSDSLFAVVRPYIIIGEQFRPQPSELERLHDSIQELNRLRFQERMSHSVPHPKEKFRIDTVSAAYLTTIGFTFRQAEEVIEYRKRGEEGIRNMEELRGCWAVSPQMADSLARYIIFPEPKPYGGKIEINSADSIDLISVYGIGPKIAKAIIDYRNLLGGYVSIGQLSEIKCITRANFARFSAQICCDSCVFSKIDINFAPASELELHPYMTREAINKITELRKSKGGWKSFEEIVNENIFTKEQAVSLEPYLYFDTTAFDDSEDSD